MQHQLHTDVEIHAAPEIVWDVITDLDRYAEWNPFIVEAAGKLAVGERLTNRLQPPGGKTTTFRPTVTEVETGETFEWLGRFGRAGIFDGRYRFEVQPTPSGGTTVTHTEQFTGVLVRMMRSSLDSQTKAGFEAMNEALKARAESRTGGAS